MSSPWLIQTHKHRTPKLLIMPRVTEVAQDHSTLPCRHSDGAAGCGLSGSRRSLDERAYCGEARREQPPESRSLTPSLLRVIYGRRGDRRDRRRQGLYGEASHGSKFCAASLLILGMEGLRPSRLLPISQADKGRGIGQRRARPTEDWSGAHECRPLCSRSRTRREAHVGARARQDGRAQSRCASTVPGVKFADPTRCRGPVQQLLRRVQGFCTSRHAAARFRSGRGRHGESRRGLAVEPRRCEGPQVRNDATRPKRAYWSILGFRPCLGCTQRLSELCHRTSALGGSSQLQEANALSPAPWTDRRTGAGTRSWYASARWGGRCRR